VILLLHGSGHDGKSLIDPWLPLAKSEGIVLVAPSASDPQAWRIPQEGDINKQAWAFLRQHTLAADPRFQSYDVRK
jgi:predicted esterase